MLFYFAIMCLVEYEIIIKINYIVKIKLFTMDKNLATLLIRNMKK